MNPQNTSPVGGPEVLPPSPLPSQGGNVVGQQPVTAEALPAMGELPQVSPPPDPSQMQAAAQQAAAPMAPPPVTAPVDDQPLSPYAPAIADDGDLIEPEWVDRAKRIVEETHDDPHRQNQEVNRLKADYIKKRYKKDIKIAEG